MNRKVFLTVFAAVSLFAAIGCGPRYVSPPPPAPGNVTLVWTLYGRSCFENPNIQYVRVTIPGEALQNNGYYPCSSNGSDGVVLYDFAPGSYSFVADAIDYNGAIIFSGGGTFVVDGDTGVSVDLTPVGFRPSWARLSWSGPDGSFAVACHRVQLEIDDDMPVSFPCADGLDALGVRSPLMAAGEHTVTLTALREDGTVLSRKKSTLTTADGKPVSASYSFEPAP